MRENKFNDSYYAADAWLNAYRRAADEKTDKLGQTAARRIDREKW